MLDLSPASVKPFAVGLLSYIPGVFRLLSRTGGTDNARYCYSVWLRHLVTVNNYGVLHGVPQTAAEIGPGDSIGIGLAALLSGVRQYSAIDIVRYVNPGRNLAVLHELLSLFRNRSPIPDDKEFPRVSPRLKSYEFPSQIITGDLLENSLSETRIREIIERVRAVGHARAPDDTSLRYVAPWTRAQVMPAASFDMIYSQAVLEHVDQLELMYQAMQYWTKPGGCITHDIDFSSHGTGPLWNSHWSYSRRAWRMIRGRRAFLLNREPHSSHVQAIRRCGFDIVADVPTRETGGISRAQLADDFRGLSDEDFTTVEAHILAVKR